MGCDSGTSGFLCVDLIWKSGQNQRNYHNEVINEVLAASIQWSRVLCRADGLLLWLMGWKLRQGLRVLFTHCCHPALDT